PEDEPAEVLESIDDFDAFVEPEAVAADETADAVATDESKEIEEPVEELLEEEDAGDGELSSAARTFLDRKVFLIKGQSGVFSMNSAWDFLAPETKKKIGTAVERPEGILQLIRFFLRRNWLPSKIEIREEKTN